MANRWVVLLVSLLFGPGVAAQEAPSIMPMEPVPFTVGAFGSAKTPAGTVESVEGQAGKACKLTFAADARGGFFTARLRPTPEWDQAAGISFWVKGDGSQSWGGLEVIDGSDYGQRCATCFPINSTEWRKIVVPWRELIPEIPAARPIDPKGAYPPSKLGNLWFGKWWYWRDYPAHSYTVERIAVEREIPLDARDFLPAQAGAPRLLAKLKAKQPVTIVTMGDSLSDKRHNSNRQSTWSEILAAKLKEAYGSEVTLVNPALGGTQLTQNLVLMPRWLKGTPRPDLVTVWFGFNDWDSGMRGERFREVLRDAVDRIRRATGGKSEVLLMATCPAIVRWMEMEEMAEAARVVAREKRTALADVAAAFHQAGAEEAARARLFADDKVHLGDAGRALAAATVLKAIGE